MTAIIRASGAEVLARSRGGIPALLGRNRWWIVRIVMVPVYLFFFAIVTFFLIRSIPGDPVLSLLGDNYAQSDYDAMQKALGLNGSLLSQLGNYLAGLPRFDLGNSLVSQQPVLPEILHLLPATLELAFCALGATIIVSILASYLVVMHPRNVVAVVIRTYSRAAGAIPDYVLAVAGLFIFYAVLHLVPAPLGRTDTSMSTPPPVTGFPLLDALLQGRFDAFASTAAHLVLPVAVMTIAQSALLVKILIVSLENALDAAPTRFRIAIGNSHLRVLGSVYRRAIPPAVTMVGTLFGYLVGGAIIIESLFGFSGLGQYAVTAVNGSDYNALQGFLLVVAAMTLIIFLLVDVANMLIDPRRRPGTTTEDA